LVTCGYDDCNQPVVERTEPFYEWYDGDLDSQDNPDRWVGCVCADGHKFNLKVQ